MEEGLLLNASLQDWWESSFMKLEAFQKTSVSVGIQCVGGETVT